MPELAAIVAAAVRERRPELELLIREHLDGELARLRANGVECIERDGRTFTVLRLPGVEPRPPSPRVPIVRHQPRVGVA